MACRIVWSVRPDGFALSRPQDHCTVPAPNTRAPLGARYSVRWWVAVPVVSLAAVVGEICAEVSVVDDMSISPGGRKPLSASTSHS